MTEITQLYLQGAAQVIDMQGAATQAMLRQSIDYVRWLQDAVDRHVPPRRPEHLDPEEVSRRLEEAQAS